jgi:hypothetical protein
MDHLTRIFANFHIPADPSPVRAGQRQALRVKKYAAHIRGTGSSILGIYTAPPQARDLLLEPRGRS